MSVAPATTAGKKPSSAVGRRVSNMSKDPSKSSRGPASRTSQSLRVPAPADQQARPLSSSSRLAKPINSQILAPLRPPDPTLFVHAGTTGVRHLFPIHLTEDESQAANLFARPISHLRSRTPTTESCSNVEMIRNICSSIRTLQHLDVTLNELHELPLDISLLVALETLNCSHNHLHEMADLFEQLKHLKSLDISFNLFKRLPDVVYTLKSLVRLNCEHNSITQFEPTFINLKRLKVFVADHNQLESVDTIDFAQMKKLEYIHLAHNQLVKFPRGLHQLHHLKNVNLSNNRLKSFPIDLLLLNTLDVLNLSHNLIAKLPPMPIAYKRASLIFSIDLSFNQLNRFYEFLLFIAAKVDVSNNKIRTLSNDFMKRLTNELIVSRELKIHSNPLVQPLVPMEMLHETNSTKINVLRMIRNCFDEQQLDVHIRQGFKICITGCKNSGKTALATCLEESMPLNLDETEDEKQERIVHDDLEASQYVLNFRTIHQFPFRFTTVNEPLSPLPPIAKASAPASAKTFELPKMPPPRTEIDTRKRRTPSSSISRHSLSGSNQSLAPITPMLPFPLLSSTTPAESTKVIPLTIFDFNGSATYYDHMSPLLDNHSLHLICVSIADFHQLSSRAIDDVFNGKLTLSSTSNLINELIQILQLLCDKATKTRAIMILPIATCVDLYEERPKQDQVEAIEKINRFFRSYLQYRTDRIKHEIQQIQSLPLISSSLSDRLKIYTALLNIHIQIEPCQPVSSVKFQGIEELNRTIQQCIFSDRTIFPHVDRILPTLWAETNQFIESLADFLPVPYLLWANFTERVISKHGLAHLIDDITMSLHDEGKIFVINEVSTTDRAVFLRPSWLTDLLYNLFRADMRTGYLDYERNEIFALNGLVETRFQVFKKEFLQHGLLHSDLLRTLWAHLLHKKDCFYHLWLTLMRFLLLAYPKMNKAQLKRLVHVHTPDPNLNSEKKVLRSSEVNYDEEDMQFDYAIVPYYLPLINSSDQQDELKRFGHLFKTMIITRYTSSALPLGFFHRFSVSAILRLNIVYKKHWNNFIIGEHEEKDVRFLLETDHRTYIICHCGTTIVQQPYEEIWNVLMPILNHFEEMFLALAPSNRFDRAVQCPYCHQFSFMGEWTTPKELQCTKTRACSACAQQVDTARLVQPNESKRRSEELLKRIRERHIKKEGEDAPATPMLVSAV